jgi:hypothetical protein
VLIRAEQMEAFEHAAVRSFEDSVLKHLKNFAPDHFRILTEDEILQVIRHGMKRAELHGFTSRRSLRIYIELMLMLGSGFDADPQLPWAAELLNDKTITGEVARIERLRDKAWEYFDQMLPDFGDVAGDARRKEFVEQIRQLRQEHHAVLPRSPSPRFYARVSALLNQGLLEKRELLCEKLVRGLIDDGIHLARSYQVMSEQGALLFVTAMFIFGSGFDKDPQLPWAAKVLNDQLLAGEQERVDRFFAVAIEALKRWLRLPLEA